MSGIPNGIRILRRAAELRVAHGHNDTCQSVLGTSEPYPCNCGHDALVEALLPPVVPKPLADTPPAMVKVDGKRFFCECGANVFTKCEGDVFRCNGCQRDYA